MFPSIEINFGRALPTWVLEPEEGSIRAHSESISPGKLASNPIHGDYYFIIFNLRCSRASRSTLVVLCQHGSSSLRKAQFEPIPSPFHQRAGLQPHSWRL